MGIYQATSGNPVFQSALFRSGFRPFFLFGAVWSVMALVYFILAFSGVTDAPPSNWDVIAWHRHEMLFGFVGAIIAGFLFTAVPNWTGRATPKGAMLAAIVGLWLAGRVAVACSAYLPALLVAVADVSFFLACAGGIAPALVQSKNKRNYVFILLLGLLATANALTHLEAYADMGIRLALAIVTMMMVIIGGRVIPFFTERRLGISITRNARLERLTLAVTVAALLLDVAAFNAGWAGGVFMVAAVTHFWRLSQWQGMKTLRIPLLWVLHVAYLWLAASFLLRAGALLDLGVPATIATHALTAGAMGGLILGMIARVSLGHSGRPLEIGRAMAVAFASVNAVAFIRVFGVWLLPDFTMGLLQLSAALWLGAFGIFVVIYAPILLRPRIDGKEG